MTKYNKTSRRSIIKHTGAAGFAFPFFGQNKNNSERNQTRLIEVAIIYDPERPLNNSVQLETTNICQNNHYNVENGTVDIQNSDNKDDIKSVMLNNPQVVNFGGVRGFERKKRIDSMNPEYLAKDTLNDTKPVLFWRSGSDSDYTTPTFTITPKRSSTVAKFPNRNDISTRINTMSSTKLGSKDVSFRTIEFFDTKYTDVRIPERMAAEKYEISSVELNTRPEFRLKDHGVVEIVE